MSEETKATKISEPKKPLCLGLVEAKNDIVNAINTAAKVHNIPFYLLESIVTDAAIQVSECAKAERAKAQQMYAQQLEEYNKK